MNVSALFVSARKIVLELESEGSFYTTPYVVRVNGNKLEETNRVVYPVENLLPDTDYHIELLRNDQVIAQLNAHTLWEYVTLNVRHFGAKGDGIHDDTLAIQAAISCCPPNSRVLVPAGRYAVTSLFLKSEMTLELAEGAILSGCLDRDRLAIVPGMIPTQDESGELNLGTWEGNPLPMFTALLHGQDIHDVVITGKGILDGNASYDNWWHAFRKIRGAYRPRMIFLNRCKNVTIEGITSRNSPSWNLHPYFSENLRLINLQVQNPMISPNTDGLDVESCRNVLIAGVDFSVGDDCIAIKSGKIYMGKTYQKPCRDIEIRHCHMKDGHGGVTLGSEMAAGIYHLLVRDCRFVSTDRGLRIKTRRGRGKDSIVEDCVFQNIEMDGVKSPFVVNCFYNDCDPDGRTSYVSSKDPLPVDDRTPAVRQLAFRNIDIKNAHYCGAFIYGLPEQKVDRVEFSHVRMSFAKDAKSGRPALMNGLPIYCKKGMVLYNIADLILDDVQIKDYDGPPMERFGVERICGQLRTIPTGQ